MPAAKIHRSVASSAATATCHRAPQDRSESDQQRTRVGPAGPRLAKRASESAAPCRRCGQGLGSPGAAGAARTSRLGLITRGFDPRPRQ